MKANQVSLRIAAFLGATLLLGFSATAPAQAQTERSHRTQSDSQLTVLALTTKDPKTLSLTEADMSRLAELGREVSSTSELTIRLATGQAAIGDKELNAVSNEFDIKNVTVRFDDAAQRAGLAPMATNCYVGSYTRYGQNVAGNNVWGEWIEIQFCWNGSSVSSTKILSTGGNTYWLGWSYDGKLGQSSAVVSGKGRNYAQHKFTYAILKIGVIQTATPCVQLHGMSVNSYGHAVFQVGTKCGLTT